MYEDWFLPKVMHHLQPEVHVLTVKVPEGDMVAFTLAAPSSFGQKDILVQYLVVAIGVAHHDRGIVTVTMNEHHRTGHWNAVCLRMFHEDAVQTQTLGVGQEGVSHESVFYQAVVPRLHFWIGPIDHGEGGVVVLSVIIVGHRSNLGHLVTHRKSGDDQ